MCCSGRMDEFFNVDDWNYIYRFFFFLSTRRWSGTRPRPIQIMKRIDWKTGGGEGPGTDFSFIVENLSSTRRRRRRVGVISGGARRDCCIICQYIYIYAYRQAIPRVATSAWSSLSSFRSLVLVRAGTDRTRSARVDTGAARATFDRRPYYTRRVRHYGHGSTTKRERLTIIQHGRTTHARTGLRTGNERRKNKTGRTTNAD